MKRVEKGKARGKWANEESEMGRHTCRTSDGLAVFDNCNIDNDFHTDDNGWFVVGNDRWMGIYPSPKSTD